MQNMAAELFKILGVENRIRIIEILKSKGPMGVNALADDLGITPAAVSQHLKVMRQARLVIPERQGYWKPYSIDENAMEHCRSLLENVCSCGCHQSAGCGGDDDSEQKLAKLKAYARKLELELASVRKTIKDLGQKEDQV